MTGTEAPPAERLARHLITMANGCIEWTGHTNDRGYGKLSVGTSTVYTHRFAWELANGPILDGLQVLHHCDNPPCCQTEPTEGYPDGHLFLGTQLDNVRDMITKGRWRGNGNDKKTHCPDNHPYDIANTYTRPNGQRGCRKCRRIQDRARWTA